MAAGAPTKAPQPVPGGQAGNRPSLSASARERYRECAASLGLEHALYAFAQAHHVGWDKLTEHFEEVRGEALDEVMRLVPVRIVEWGLASDGNVEALGMTLAEAVSHAVESRNLDVDGVGESFCVRALAARDEAIRVAAAGQIGNIREARWNVSAQSHRMAIGSEAYLGRPEFMVELGLRTGGVVAVVLSFRNGWSASPFKHAPLAEIEALIALRAAELKRLGTPMVAAYGGSLSPINARAQQGSGIELRAYSRVAIEQLIVDVSAEAARATQTAELVKRDDASGVLMAPGSATVQAASPGHHCAGCAGKAICSALQRELTAETKLNLPMLRAVDEASRSLRSTGNKFPLDSEIESIAAATLQAAGFEPDQDALMDTKDIARLIVRLQELRPLAALVRQTTDQVDTLASELLAQGHELVGIGTKAGKRQTTVVVGADDRRSELAVVFAAMAPLRGRGKLPEGETDEFEFFCREVGKVQVGSLADYLKKIGVGKNKAEREGLLEKVPALAVGTTSPSLVISEEGIATGTPGVVEVEPIGRARQATAAAARP